MRGRRDKVYASVCICVCKMNDVYDLLPWCLEVRPPETGPAKKKCYFMFLLQPGSLDPSFFAVAVD